MGSGRRRKREIKVSDKCSRRYDVHHFKNEQELRPNQNNCRNQCIGMVCHIKGHIITSSIRKLNDGGMEREGGKKSGSPRKAG